MRLWTETIGYTSQFIDNYDDDDGVGTSNELIRHS